MEKEEQSKYGFHENAQKHKNIFFSVKSWKPSDVQMKDSSKTMLFA